MTVTIACLAYGGIEPIDIGATYGVLSMAKRIAPELEFFVVARSAAEVMMANGLRIIADYGFEDCPSHDALIVLGGPGWEAASADEKTLSFIHASSAESQVVASVCTGAMIVGAAGLLADRRATTKCEVFAGETAPVDLIERRYGAIAMTARVVDTGDIVTGGGVSLGIDLTLHLVERFCGAEVANETARVLEYSSARQANAARLPDYVIERST
jgi:transcriptional regulator GlxA family with amidase domain